MCGRRIAVVPSAGRKVECAVKSVRVFRIITLVGILVLAALPCLAQEQPASALDQFKAHYLEGEYDQAEALLKEAVDQYLKDGNQKDASDLLYRLGFLYDHIGKFDQAMGAYGDAQQLARIVGDQALVVRVAFNSAATSLSLGDAKRALAIYQGLLEAFEAAGAEEAKARCLQNRGAVLMQQGELAPAYKDLTEALRIYESKDSQGRIAETVTNLGILLTRENLYDQAKEQYERAAAIFAEMNDQRSLSTVLINQAELAQKQGDAATALALLDKALESKKATNDRMGEAAALQVIAKTQHSQGDYDKAVDTLGQSLALRVELKDTLGEGFCHLLMGEWLFRIGGSENLQRADVHLNRAYDAFKNAGYKQFLQRVLYWQGRIADARGNTEQAEKKFNEAITELESLTYRLPDDLQAARAVSSERSEPYEALVSLLIRQNRLPEALAYLDRSRDQNLAKDLIGGTSEEISYQSRIATLRERIEQAKSEKDTKLAEMLAKEAEGVQDAYAKHVEDLFRSNPQLYALTQVNPDVLNRIRKHLDSQSLMIQYLFYEDNLFLFAVTSDKLDYRTVKIDKKSLESRITYLRDMLRISFRFYPPCVKTRIETDPKWKDSYDKTFMNPIAQVGQRLYGELIAPLSELLEGKTRLVVIPNQSLHYLPFAALVASKEGETTRYLVEDFEILKQGSLTLLDFARGGAVEEPVRLLAIGNADGTLPNAQEEAERLKNIFTEARVLIRDEATEDVFKSLCSNKTILHLATHAFLDPGDLDKCYIQLAPAWDKGEDGSLWRREVLDLSLDKVSLVTLSACETGIGEHRLQGDEVYGMEQSFVKAGAETVISTLWQVEDKATGLFMETFYNNLVQSLSASEGEKRMNKLGSLRLAQMKLLNHPQYFHPYFWAPFVMTGEAE